MEKILQFSTSNFESVQAILSGFQQMDLERSIYSIEYSIDFGHQFQDFIYNKLKQCRSLSLRFYSFRSYVLHIKHLNCVYVFDIKYNLSSCNFIVKVHRSRATEYFSNIVMNVHKVLPPDNNDNQPEVTDGEKLPF